MIYTDPTLNGIPINIFRLVKGLSPHPFRTRVMIRNLAYEQVITEAEAQVIFFSKDALVWRNNIGRLRTLGYALTLYDIIKTLGTIPMEEDWIRYRIQFPNLGNKYYSITSCTPCNHLDGEWLYLRIDFEEDKSSDSTGLTENTEEFVPSTEEFVELTDV
jgi:hypothetical protein